jgi:hypothetical protein
MNGFFYAPLKPNSYRIEKQIVEALREIDPPAEYPLELYEPRRASYLQQITTLADALKKSRPALQSGDGGQ